MCYVRSHKNGASALGLPRVLGLGSYQTAWAWLHKLHRAMVGPGRDHLTGWIEVDETYLGGWEEGMKGRRRGEKSLVVIAAQVVGNGPGASGCVSSPTHQPAACILLSKAAWSLAARSTPADGRAIWGSTRKVMATKFRPCEVARGKPVNYSRECTAWHPC